MKRIVLALCLVSSVAVKYVAQAPASPVMERASEQRKDLSPEERAKREADAAEKNLALSSEQKTKWQSAALERARANAPIREKMKGSTTPDERKALHAQMKENKRRYHETVVALLSPEQKTKYEALKKDRKVGMHRVKGKRHVPETPGSASPQ